MPLYIRDDEVDALAAEVQRRTGASTKTEAVRQALQREIARIAQEVPLRQRLAELRKQAEMYGLPNRDFDMKKFSDELWDDE
ncbi:Rv0623-like transcription factor [Variibacter gotjawalensis]|uniref:Rv0623-like transcription factor n=1 Tax=Variibacter gotjawalensis TaxID=1333996 RepID=A0A0S3PUM1_9BRAD|nr:type II toxin-antitoxin system VapB family antitoxin [Variibacter gotjawalensis]NIK49989.1 antitoxin VapB [Variibacter gotjawalensis]RZS45988.1 antitoxin VapB [Variibacter gotjawalensis]BAT59663.1 Rv0623-like transcription factor [Variibacter gotjawalensis]